VGLNCGQFRAGCDGKIGLKTVLDHGGVGRGDKIEVDGLAGMHETSSLKVKGQPTTPRYCVRRRDGPF
jgi:hypothetical protein